jgi:hypothetical protein
VYDVLLGLLYVVHLERIVHDHVALFQVDSDQRIDYNIATNKKNKVRFEVEKKLLYIYIIRNMLFGISKLNQFMRILLKMMLETSVTTIEETRIDLD